MRVQRMLMPDGAESWTVLDASGEPVPDGTERWWTCHRSRRIMP